MAYDPLADTALALAPIPDTTTGFGVAELATLLALQDGPGRDRSRELLGIGATYADDTVTLAGLSALTARGLLTAGDDAFQPRSSALLIAMALTQATRWTRVGVLDDVSPQAAILTQSPTVDALVEAGPMVTWWVGFQEPDVGVAQVLSRLVEDRLSPSSPGRTVVVDVQEAGGSVGNLLIRRVAPDGYDVIADVGPGGVGGRAITLGATGLVGLFEGYVAPSLAQPGGR